MISKYRVWDKRQSKYIKLYLSLADGEYELNELFGGSLYPEMVFQLFTGVIDINGKDIFDGDIVRFFLPSCYKTGDSTGYVRYFSRQGGFAVDCRTDLNTQNEINQVSAYGELPPVMLLSSACCIIGNIFENADLLPTSLAKA